MDGHLCRVPVLRSIVVFTIVALLFSTSISLAAEKPSADSDRLTIVITAWDPTTKLLETFLEGRTQPGAVVTLKVNGEFFAAQKTGPDGGFLFTGVPVEDGSNELTLRAENDLGESGTRRLVTKAGRFTDLKSIGLAELEVSAGSGGESANATGFSLKTDGNLAFYLEGTVLGNYDVISAYDSRNALDQWAKPSGSGAPLMGDTSVLSRKVSSRDNAFLQIDAPEGQFMYGDINTNLGAGEFGAYDRTLLGSRLTFGQAQATGAKLSGGVYRSVTRRSSTTETIPGQGTTGFYRLANRPVVDQSEVVQLVILDPSHPDTPIEALQQRDIDYFIDYANGTLLFKRPVPTHDGRLNPVFIVVSYEYEGAGQTTVTGGRLSYSLPETWSAGWTYVQETGGRPFRLSAFDVSQTFESGYVLTAEAGKSRQDGGTGSMTDGTAVTVGVQTPLTQAVQGEVTYRQVSGGFSAQPGTMTGVDTEKISGSVDLPIPFTSDTWLRADAFLQTDRSTVTGLDRRTDAVGGELNRSLDRWTLSTGWRHVTVSDRGVTAGNSGTIQIDARADYRISQNWTAGVSREVAARTSTGVLADPPGVEGTTGLHAAYQLGKDTSVSADWYQGDSGVTAGSLALEETVSDGRGNTARVQSKFALQGVAGAMYGQLGTGVDTRWQVSQDFAVDVSYDKQTPSTLALGQATSPFRAAAGSEAVSVGFEYTPKEGRYRLGSRYGVSVSGATVKRTYTLGLLGEVTRDLSARIRWSIADGPGPLPDRDWLGQLTYRPTAGQATFGRVMYQSAFKNIQVREPDGSGATYWGTSEVNEWSAEGSRQFLANLAFNARWARRSVVENDAITSPATTATQLAQLGLEYGLGENWGLTASWRTLAQAATNSSTVGNGTGIYRDFGQDKMWRVEGGYRHQKSQIDDAPWNWRTGPYLRLAAKF